MNNFNINKFRLVQCPYTDKWQIVNGLREVIEEFETHELAMKEIKTYWT